MSIQNKELNIKRNSLDYIITDILPVELSDRFTYIYFYDFLNSKSKILNKEIESIKSAKNENKELFRNSKWSSMPLKYTISKDGTSEREMSLLQPIAALILYVFITLYQKEMLTLLNKNAVFSIRYQKKNNNLYYKKRNKTTVEYFSKKFNENGLEMNDVESIEKSGMYFSVGPYSSLTSFYKSDKWFLMASKYKFFIHTDYKDCFGSIYTHDYDWILGKDVNDTKKFSNSSIYRTIDRILMEINNKTSNGIVVGPEASRMFAELLLQYIDMEVYNNLLNHKILRDTNYNIYRYVDDLYIFADSDITAHLIYKTYADVARKYLLNLNDKKYYEHMIPFEFNDWINETYVLTNRICGSIFKSRSEYESEEKEENKYILKSNTLSRSKSNYKRQINSLICKYYENRNRISSYILSSMINHVSNSKKRVSIFKKPIKEKNVFSFIEFVLYIYSIFPNYNNTQKLLMIISYVNDELDIVSNGKLQGLFNRYSFVFDKANINDIVNLILFCKQANIEIPYMQEKSLEKILNEKDDPILWASYLLYAEYDSNYFSRIKIIVNDKLNENIRSILIPGSAYMYREFWWVLIFNKAKYTSKRGVNHQYISDNNQNLINNLLDEMKTSDGSNSSKIPDLIIEFMQTKNHENDTSFDKNIFFNWNMDDDDYLSRLTFKTKERTYFMNGNSREVFFDY